MTGKFGFFALAVLSILPIAVAQDLAIVGGGRRIVDRDPSTPASNCSGWTYGASPLVDDTGNIIAMYTVSDAITNHCKVSVDSESRFGDVIQRHQLNDDGTWSKGENVVDRANLAWMSDPSFIAAHPESIVGHLSSPSVVRLDGRYFMAFVGSVADPNLCAAEHAPSNICGSCVDPWSYFVVMWAVSDDGVHWQVRERNPGDALLIGRRPGPGDALPGSNFKGISRVTLLTHEEGGRKYFYIGGLYWAATTMKTLMLRIPYDPTSEWGMSADPELWSWNQKTWLACPDGIIPDLMNDPNEQSLLMLFNPLSSITRTTVRGTGREEYIALTIGSSHALPDWRGVSNEISYQFSNNLVDWEYPRYLRSTMAYFADGYSYDASVIDPIAVDDHGALRLFFASADGDEAFGIGRDGQHDCEPGSGFGATAPYVGTGIYESSVEMITPRPTRTTMTLDRTTVVAGQPIHCVIEVTDERGGPVDGVVEIFTGARTRVRLAGGRAEADVTYSRDGQNVIDAFFANQGLWQSSGTGFTTIQVLPNTARRRSVKH